MKKVFLVLVLLVLLACAPKLITCPDGTVVNNPEKCVSVVEDMLQDFQNDSNKMIDDLEKANIDDGNSGLNTVGTDSDLNNADSYQDSNVADGSGPTTLDPLAAELKAKAQKNHNYKFLFAEYPENKATRTYYVRGDLVKLELYSPSLWKGSTFDTVFLDYSTKKAVAYCLDKYHCDDNPGIVERPTFIDYSIRLPHQWMDDMDFAESIGSITVDDQAAERFKFKKDGLWYYYIVQKFYGIPQRVTWFDNEAMEGEPNGYEFRDIAFNMVKESDVTPPDGW